MKMNRENTTKCWERTAEIGLGSVHQERPENGTLSLPLPPTPTHMPFHGGRIPIIEVK